MKKTICVLAVMACCMLFPCRARADVIWEPMDSFYQNHSSECEHMGRFFTADGPDGKVMLYKSPEMPEVLETWDNGYQVYIHFTYEDKDGITWGVYDDYEGTVGWVPMDYMSLVYDSIAFREEHAAELVAQEGELDEAYLGKEIQFWKYPGSEVHYTEQTGDYMPSYQTVYQDGNGHSWGCVGYYFGSRDFWVCIDAPDAEFEELYPDGPAQEVKAEDGEGISETDRTEAGEQDAEAARQKETDKRIAPKPDYGTMILAVVLVAAVVAGTAGLLVVLKRRK